MSEIHPDSPQGKFPEPRVASLTAMASPQPLPLTMGQDVYEDPRCFVLMDEQTVGVMPGDPAVQRLLTGDEAGLGVSPDKGIRMVQVDGRKTLEVVQMGDKEAVEMAQVEEKEGAVGVMGVPGGQTVEVLHMEGGRTVEVVQMDGGKTLEVVHIDAGKHTEVIHIEGGGGLDFLGEGDAVKLPTIHGSSPPQRQVLVGEKEKHVLPDSIIPSVDIKRVITTQTGHGTANLRPLGPGNSSIVISTGKSGLVQGYSPSTMTFPTSVSKSQGLGDRGINSNIVFSDPKEVLTGAGDGLDNAIIISWPAMTRQEAPNTVGTQTDLCVDDGPSLNLFFCTFHADGSVQTQCDLPSWSHKSVSTENGLRCRAQARVKTEDQYPGEGNLLLLGMEEEEEEEEEEVLKGGEADQRFSRSGRVLKGKGPLFKVDSSLTEEDSKGDPDFQLHEEEMAEAEPQALVYRKKRGRKRKKRLPSPDNFEEDLQFTNEDEKDHTNATIKQESEEDTKDSELAMEILKTKGYGLRTKRRPKKLSDMHYLQEKLVKRRLDRSQEFPCQLCSRTFPTFSRLQRHAKEEHNSTDFSFPCNLCNVVFTRPHNLERHKETKHGDGEKRFVCEHCGRRFGRQDVLSVHVAMVHLKRTVQSGKKGLPMSGAGAYHCTSCNKFFSKEQRLREHRQGDFTCEDCSVSFECKTSLREHQYKHHPTACSKCGKVCDNKQQMYFHRLSHAPKFICKFCNKGFLWESQYMVHIATHTGDKPVLCDVCGKSFAHKLAVSKHKWQEHNENNKKFKCEHCGKSFVYKGKLQSHMRRHTGEKPFVCEVCSCTFSQRSNRTAHIKSVHGVYIQSIKSDGTVQSQLVRYKRAKKSAPAEPPPPPPPQADVNTVMAHSVESPAPVPQPHIAIQDQGHMSESFETEAAVYQIVYAYPQ